MSLETEKLEKALPLTKKIELGIVGGTVASISMGVAIIIAAGLGFENPRLFTLIPETQAMPGPSYELGLIGLTWHFIIGVVWGLIYAFLFRTYSVTKGLGIGGVQLLVFAIYLTNIEIPGYGVSLMNMPVLEAAKIITTYGLAYAVYGATIGLVAKKIA